jgi:hypothetical protein
MKCKNCGSVIEQWRGKWGHIEMTDCRQPEPIAACPGPAALWPCALEFGHGGDHERVSE